MGKRGMNPIQAAEVRARKTRTKLEKVRLSKGLSQNELAIKSGVDVRRIQYYEQNNGSIDKARIHNLCLLCIALDCKLEDLLETEETIDKLKLIK